jgi:hypothetical protein
MKVTHTLTSIPSIVTPPQYDTNFPPPTIGQGVLIQLGANSIVGVTGFYNIDDKRHIVIVGTTNGRVHEIFWKSGQVGIEGHGDLPVQFTPGSIVSVSGFYNIDDKRHIVIVGTTNGRVHEIFWPP